MVSSLQMPLNGAILAIIAGMLLIQPLPATASRTRRLFNTRQTGPPPALSNVTGYYFSGKATQYEDDLPSDGAADFTCSFPYISPWAQQYYVALNVEQWEGGKNCGRCVKVTCTDPKCAGQAEVVAYIVDQCATCKYGDLDFGITPWGDLTGITPDRVQVAWNFTSCHNYINDTIHYAPKDGSSEGWQAFFFSNTRYRPSSVKLNGVKLEMTENNFWVHDDDAPEAPYNFELASYGGASIKFEVDDLFTAQDTRVQFTYYYKSGKPTAS